MEIQFIFLQKTITKIYQNYQDQISPLPSSSNVIGEVGGLKTRFTKLIQLFRCHQAGDSLEERIKELN